MCYNKIRLNNTSEHPKYFLDEENGSVGVDPKAPTHRRVLINVFFLFICMYISTPSTPQARLGFFYIKKKDPINRGGFIETRVWYIYTE